MASYNRMSNPDGRPRRVAVTLGAMVLGGVIAGWMMADRNASAQQIDIEEIFWCNEEGMTGEQTRDECLASRNAIFNNCTSCHTFGPIVIAQRTESEWNSFLNTHRERVEDMGDDEFEQLRLFLIHHFNPDQPVPDLPPALLEGQTGPA